MLPTGAFFYGEKAALLPATQARHPQPAQCSFVFSVLLRGDLCCYESELEPNALSVGKAATDLSSETALRRKAHVEAREKFLLLHPSATHFTVRPVNISWMQRLCFMMFLCHLMTGVPYLVLRNVDRLFSERSS